VMPSVEPIEPLAREIPRDYGGENPKRLRRSLSRPP
jgi:hypothetical protein